MSPSGSVALTVPVTTPLPGSGWGTSTPMAAGPVLAAPMATLTGTSSTPPWPSSTVRVKLSCRSSGPAVSAAAVWRAVSVGV